MSHAYSPTPGGLSQTITQLRSAFPSEVSSDTLKKWSIAPNNETYIINVLKFLGIIDDEGKKQMPVAKVFNEHDDAAFAAGFAPLIKSAYGSLFETFGDKTWDQSTDKLIGFFRNSDGTSAVVGKRQAQTFRALATLAGHAPPNLPAKPSSTARPTGGGRVTKKAAKRTADPVIEQPRTPRQRTPSENGFSSALTVRVEINLPVTDDQAVYDKIFRSIRSNLIDDRSDEPT